MKDAGLIYTLACPESGMVRYVGQTINLEKRIGLHLYHSKNGRARTHKEKWINEVIAKALKPDVEVVWEGPVELLDQKETEFIALYKSFGAKLTNATMGGMTTRGRKCSEETKAKIIAAQKGRPRAWKYTEETLRKMRERPRRPMLESAKQKLSLAKKGKPSIWKTRMMNEEYKRRIAATGKLMSKQIIAIKDGVETHYDSLVDAAKGTGCERRSLTRVATGEYKQTKGYIFKFKSPKNE